MDILIDQTAAFFISLLLDMCFYFLFYVKTVPVIFFLSILFLSFYFLYFIVIDSKN